MSLLESLNINIAFSIIDQISGLLAWNYSQELPTGQVDLEDWLPLESQPMFYASSYQ